MTQEYCPSCQEKQPVIETVAWQNNACSVCSQEIPQTKPAGSS